MRKRIGALEAYYIDNNLNLPDAELAKTTGLSLKQVQAHRRKQEGLNRSGNPKTEEDTGVTSSPERATALVEQAQEAAKTLPPVQAEALNARPAPSMRIDALIARGNGTASMTGAAAQLADSFDGISPDESGKLPAPVVKRFDPFADETRVHRIKR